MKCGIPFVKILSIRLILSKKQPPLGVELQGKNDQLIKMGYSQYLKRCGLSPSKVWETGAPWINEYARIFQPLKAA